MSRKAFIWNVKGLSAESSGDIKNFLETTEIASDVQLSNFKVNFDQLPKGTIFAVGGGSSEITRYTNQRSDAWQMICRQVVTNKMHYLGVCAGAILAGGSPIIFSPSLEDSLQLSGMMPRFTDEVPSFNLTELVTCAPFYKLTGAVPSIAQETAVKYGYAASMSYSESGKSQHLLYADSPAFLTNDQSRALDPLRRGVGLFDYDIVAHYDGNLSFHEAKSKKTHKIASPAAMIVKKPRDRQGGVFLSGLHFEASVDGSAMQSAFNDGIPGIVSKLSGDDMAILNDPAHKVDVRDAVAGKIKRAFTVT